MKGAGSGRDRARELGLAARGRTLSAPEQFHQLSGNSTDTVQRFDTLPMPRIVGHAPLDASFWRRSIMPKGFNLQCAAGKTARVWLQGKGGGLKPGQAAGSYCRRRTETQPSLPVAWRHSPAEGDGGGSAPLQQLGRPAQRTKLPNLNLRSIRCAASRTSQWETWSDGAASRRFRVCDLLRHPAAATDDPRTECSEGIVPLVQRNVGQIVGIRIVTIPNKTLKVRRPAGPGPRF